MLDVIPSQSCNASDGSTSNDNNIQVSTYLSYKLKFMVTFVSDINDINKCKNDLTLTSFDSYDL